MTPTACPACTGLLEPWREVPAGEPSDGRRYPLLRCASCGTAATGGDPPPPELYEEGTYTEREPLAAPAVRAGQRVLISQAVRLLRRAGLSEDARVLDAGSGRGGLVAALIRHGYAARGIEPSSRSATLAARNALPVTRTRIEEHDDSNLDAAVLWHVLEHLDDPAGALRRIASWLRPRGLLLVAVPNLASLQSALAGERWFHLDVPRHRTHLTPRGLERLLGRAGFTTDSLHHLVWEQNMHSMWMTVLTRLGMTPGFPFHLLKRNVEARPRDLALLVAGLPLAPVAAVLEIAAAGLSRGGTVAAVARRA